MMTPVFVKSGCYEEDLCWHLVLQALSPNGCWRSVGLLHNSCSNCPLCCSPFEGNEGAVENFFCVLSFVNENTRIVHEAGLILYSSSLYTVDLH